MKQYSYLFLAAFSLNWLWENLHSVLYVHYQSGGITQWVLTRAALWDAVFVVLIIWLASQLTLQNNKRSWLILLLGFIVAVGIEWWALETGRWAYTELMPIIPILGTGLTPTIQLALTGYLSYRMIFRS